MPLRRLLLPLLIFRRRFFIFAVVFTQHQTTHTSQHRLSPYADARQPRHAPCYALIFTRRASHAAVIDAAIIVACYFAASHTLLPLLLLPAVFSLLDATALMMSLLFCQRQR